MEKKPKRIRFSLRTLLILTVVAGAAIGVYVSRAESQKRVSQWLRTEHGRRLHIYYNFQHGRGKSIPAGAETVKPSVPELLVDMLGIDYFATITALDCEGVDDLEKISELRGLEILAVATPSPCDLSRLSNLKNLRSLILHMPTNDLSPLYCLASLKDLHLKEGEFSEAELSRLKSEMPEITVWVR